MWMYDVWWKETTSGQILNNIVNADSQEGAKEVILNIFGYKTWDVKFTKVTIRT